MDKTTGGIIECFRACMDLEHGWIQDLKWGGGGGGGGGYTKCARKHAKKIHSATLTFKSTTRFGHCGHNTES